MPHVPVLNQHPCLIPADCFNRIRLAQRRSPGRLQFPLPGLADNIMIITGIEWQCWNRPLNALLLSWQGFRSNDRTGLAEPVDCTLAVHHSYSRTIIYRVYDSLREHFGHAEPRPGPCSVLTFPRHGEDPA